MKKNITILFITLLAIFNVNETDAQEGFLGEIRMFAGNFPPRGWAFCEGQLLPISQNQSLYSILGTTYGGDGRTTFALPDFRGRAVMHAGTGPGLSPRNQGEKGGTETNTLTVAQMPGHTHPASIGVINSTGTDKLNGIISALPGGFASTATSNEFLAGATTSNVGSGNDINNRQPYLAISYIICLQGTFPSRN